MHFYSLNITLNSYYCLFCYYKPTFCFTQIQHKATLFIPFFKGCCWDVARLLLVLSSGPLHIVSSRCCSPPPLPFWLPGHYIEDAFSASPRLRFTRRWLIVESCSSWSFFPLPTTYYIVIGYHLCSETSNGTPNMAICVFCVQTLFLPNTQLVLQLVRLYYIYSEEKKASFYCLQVKAGGREQNT